MSQRLVATLEVWVVAMDGKPTPEFTGPLQPRLADAGVALTRIVRRLRDRCGWDNAFMDALCDPPQAFTYGAVLAHILSYGAVRRETLADLLTELGAPVTAQSADPILWETKILSQHLRRPSR